MNKDREKEIKYEMYLRSVKINEEKKALKNLRLELENLRNKENKRIRKK